MGDNLAQTIAFDGFVRLTDWALLRAHGADAAAFLQSQLTQDVVGLQTGEARLSGYCTAKGRLLASFVVWRMAPTSSACCAAPTWLLRCASACRCTCCARVAASTMRAVSGRCSDWPVPQRSGSPWSAAMARAPARRTMADRRCRRSTQVPRWLLVPPAGVQPPALPALGPASVALARGDERRAENHGGHGGAVRAADDQFRAGRRRELSEGLLSGPGSGGAKPVSRHRQASHASVCDQRFGAAGARGVPQRRRGSTGWHGGQRGRVAAGGRLRCWPKSSSPYSTVAACTWAAPTARCCNACRCPTRSPTWPTREHRFSRRQLFVYYRVARAVVHGRAAVVRDFQRASARRSIQAWPRVCCGDRQSAMRTSR